MTIHTEHPFLPPEEGRDPIRRFRGRLGGVVSLWTSAGSRPAGLPVSSLLVAPGEPARILAVLDPDSDLVETLRASGTAVVGLLSWRHRQLADAFAGVAPAPGGAFRMAAWEDTAWGPRLSDAATWAGVRVDAASREVGWSLLVETIVEHVEVGDDPAPLVSRRGRYLRPPD